MKEKQERLLAMLKDLERRATPEQVVELRDIAAQVTQLPEIVLDLMLSPNGKEFCDWFDQITKGKN